MSRRVRLCARGDLTAGQVQRFEVDGGPAVAVYDVDGRLYATADRCTHARASLADGDLEGDEIVCPVHWGRFHVPTGRALAFPVTKDVATYPVLVEDGQILLELDEGEGQ